jgi:hypothetical protein
MDDNTYGDDKKASMFGRLKVLLDESGSSICFDIELLESTEKSSVTLVLKLDRNGKQHTDYSTAPYL